MIFPLVLLGAVLQAQPAAAPFRAQVDHFVVAIRSLDEGVAAFQGLTGVKAVPGGKHPNRGTENALVSLGNGTYLEIIAPQKEAKLSPLDAPMRDLAELTVIGWAVSVSSPEEARARMIKAGTTPSPITGGSRVTPSGATLEWQTVGLLTPQIDVAPFFIHWKEGTPHPSTTSAKGCTLSKVEVADPAAGDLTKLLSVLGVSGVAVTNAPSAIRVSLTCPKGPVMLRTRE